MVILLLLAWNRHYYNMPAARGKVAEWPVTQGKLAVQQNRAEPPESAAAR
jgi:hypothetical protein